MPLDWRRRVRRRLLAWFARHGRGLPWRRDRDPYRIWVSEVMLQQTQVATVIPFFERFVTAYPEIPALAAADEQDVLRHWEGLGYYRRARNLHACARVLALRHGGALPNDPQALQALPGMGRYTINAILSQAFEARLPILEANSRRVLCRLLGLRISPTARLAEQVLWSVGEELLPRRRIGDFNQSLMELGALCCTPTKPRCGSCPLESECAARRLGLQEAIPVRAQRPAAKAVEEAGVVVWRRGKVLLVQRPQTGRWANLWEFPHTEVAAGESHQAAARRLLENQTGVTADLGPELLTVHHSVMHYVVTLIAFEARYRAGRFQSSTYQDAVWAEPNRLHAFPVSRPQRRLALAVAEARQRHLF